MTPTAKIHLSCFALRSTIRMVSPLTPSVFATLYNLFCVPFNISLCWPRSPRTACPLAKYSSKALWVFLKKSCSRNAWFSRDISPEFMLICPEELGAHWLGACGRLALAYGLSGVPVWCGRLPKSSPLSRVSRATSASSDCSLSSLSWFRKSCSSARNVAIRPSAFSFFCAFSSVFARLTYESKVREKEVREADICPR